MSRLEWKRKTRARIETFEAQATDGGTLRLEWLDSNHCYVVSYRPLFGRHWCPVSGGSAPTVPAAVIIAEDYDERAIAWAESRKLANRQ
jgi:hypothetical protein